MKLFIANTAKPQQGGGFSFITYFKQGMADLVTENYSESTHMLIPSASMVKPEIAEQAKAEGKKVVLRVDNILRHSRNDGKGMARMQRIAAVADLVVYQCQWAKSLLDPFLNYPVSTIIYNGIDLDTFKPEGDRVNFGYPTYLYAAASKGENKRWDAAYYSYIKAQQSNPNARLLIAGKVSTPVMQNNFDFFNQERYTYLGMITSPSEMAKLYRSAHFFYAVAENDCYSNSILEALACGLELEETSMTGGTPELLDNWLKGRDFNSVHRMASEYRESLINL